MQEKNMKVNVGRIEIQLWLNVYTDLNITIRYIEENHNIAIEK